MTFEEYESKLSDIVKSPDQAALLVQDVLSELKTDCETRASLEAAITEKDSRIKGLQDVNMKLYLQVTGSGNNQEPEEEKPKTFEEKLFELDKQNKGE